MVANSIYDVFSGRGIAAAAATVELEMDERKMVWYSAGYGVGRWGIR